MTPRLLAILFCCAYAGCKSPPPRVFVDRHRGMDGAWRLPVEEQLVSLDATGTVLTLRYAGRTFVFHGVGALRGSMEEAQVYLRGDTLRIGLTPGYLQVQELGDLAKGPGETRRWPLADLPQDRPIVYRDGDLSY